MSIKARIYINPKCSKSREALRLIHTQPKLEVEEIRYLENPPTEADLADICQKLNTKPTEIIRANEVLFQAMGLTLDDPRSDQEWFSILHEHPKLIQRPIVVIEDQALVARPPNDLSAFLQQFDS